MSQSKMRRFVATEQRQLAASREKNASLIRLCSECRGPLLRRLKRCKTCCSACRMARSRRLARKVKAPKIRFSPKGLKLHAC